MLKSLAWWFRENKLDQKRRYAPAKFKTVRARDRWIRLRRQSVDCDKWLFEWCVLGNFKKKVLGYIFSCTSMSATTITMSANTANNNNNNNNSIATNNNEILTPEVQVTVKDLPITFKVSQNSQSWASGLWSTHKDDHQNKAFVRENVVKCIVGVKRFIPLLKLILKLIAKSINRYFFNSSGHAPL